MTYPRKDLQSPFELRVTNDRTPPVVELDRIAAAEPGEAIRVSARVTDPSGIDRVRLRYRHLTQFEDYEAVEMILDEPSGHYVGTIPGEFVIPHWDVMYFIEAFDEAGNGRMYPDLESEMPYVIVHLRRDP